MLTEENSYSEQKSAGYSECSQLKQQQQQQLKILSVRMATYSLRSLIFSKLPLNM